MKIFVSLNIISIFRALRIRDMRDKRWGGLMVVTKSWELLLEKQVHRPASSGSLVQQDTSHQQLWLGVLEVKGISRFWKSTHISMISNSVTHLQSYSNSAIADITGNSAPISPKTPCELRYRSAELRAPMSPRWVLMSPHRAPISSHWMAECSSVSWCFTKF